MWSNFGKTIHVVFKTRHWHPLCLVIKPFMTDFPNKLQDSVKSYNPAAILSKIVYLSIVKTLFGAINQAIIIVSALFWRIYYATLLVITHLLDNKIWLAWSHRICNPCWQSDLEVLNMSCSRLLEVVIYL